MGDRGHAPWTGAGPPPWSALGWGRGTPRAREDVMLVRDRGRASGLALLLLGAGLLPLVPRAADSELVKLLSSLLVAALYLAITIRLRQTRSRQPVWTLSL